MPNFCWCRGIAFPANKQISDGLTEAQFHMCVPVHPTSCRMFIITDHDLCEQHVWSWSIFAFVTENYNCVNAFCISPPTPPQPHRRNESFNAVRERCFCETVQQQNAGWYLWQQNRKDVAKEGPITLTDWIQIDMKMIRRFRFFPESCLKEFSVEPRALIFLPTCKSFESHGRMQGWESECWLDLAKNVLGCWKSPIGTIR